MKALFVLFISLFLSAANAGQVSVIKASSLKFSQSRCDQGKKCPAVLRYNLLATYKAHGCLDGLEATAEDGGRTKSGKRILNLRGLNLHNPKSQKVMCVAQPQKTFTFELGLGVSPDDVKVVELTE